MREGDLAGPRERAAADQPRGRDRVVRRAEGSAGREPPVAEPGDALHARDLDRLLEARRRQDPRKAAREHGLPHPRRPDHQQVVAPGRRQLERAPGVALTPHLKTRQRRTATRKTPTKKASTRAGARVNDADLRVQLQSQAKPFHLP